VLLLCWPQQPGQPPRDCTPDPAAWLPTARRLAAVGHPPIQLPLRLGWELRTVTNETCTDGLSRPNRSCGTGDRVGKTVLEFPEHPVRRLSRRATGQGLRDRSGPGARLDWARVRKSAQSPRDGRAAGSLVAGVPESPRKKSAGWCRIGAELTYLLDGGENVLADEGAFMTLARIGARVVMTRVELEEVARQPR
jgi:hypothetical protein